MTTTNNNSIWDEWEAVYQEQESRKSIFELHWAGYTAYRQAQYDSAVSFFTEAAELARQQEDTEAQAQNLYWEGESHYLNNALNLSLARFLQADQLNALDSKLLFQNLYRIVSVAAAMPISLHELYQLMRKLEPYKGGQQIGGSKSLVLYLEGLVLSRQGRYSDALAKSQEAFSSRVHQVPSYDDKFYFSNLVISYRLAGQYSQARSILAQWGSEATYNFADEKSWILKENAILLYWEGQLDAAWDMLLYCLAEESYICRAGKEIDTLVWLIRVGTELGHFHIVSSLIHDILRFRHRESLFDQFSCYISVARYCCLYSIQSNHYNMDIKRIRRHARFWLNRSSAVAEKLDALLETGKYKNDVLELYGKFSSECGDFGPPKHINGC